MPVSAVARVTDPPQIVPSDALIDKRSGKPKRIPKTVRHAIRLIESGEVTTIKAAAERVGLSREHLSKSLAMPHIQAFLTQRANENIGAGVLRASVRAIELIDAKSEHVAADTSFRVLAMRGIKPPDEAHNPINLAISVGYVIDLSGKSAAPVNNVITGNAGQVIDNVEDSQ